SSHMDFKEAVIKAQEGDTQLTMKQLTPVRLMQNDFFKEVQAAEARGASVEEMTATLGRARAKKGMFEGDMSQGELEIGQVSAILDRILPAGDIVKNVWTEFSALLENPLKKD